MDPVTHGLIGASASQSFADKEKIRPVAFIGFISAMIPDLDVLIGNSTDPLLYLEFHRQFTHAFIFIPVGALITTGLLWWFVRKKISFKEAYLFSLLGYATAGLADTFTSYGVQLLWPFTDERFAWNIISIFDPLFSLGVVLAVGFAFFKKDKSFAWWSICWMALYLLFGMAQGEQSKDIALKLAEERQHPVQKLIVKPTIANEILWSIRYVSGDSLYADGVRLLPFSEPIIYEGTAAKLLSGTQEYRQFKGSVLYRDIQRFSKLSENILIAHPDYKNVIGDGRYAMLPTSVSPLWGIKTDPLQPDQHVEFKAYREATSNVRTQFKEMLLGNY